MIERRNGKWEVLSHRKDKSGKPISHGSYSTYKEAKDRLTQVEMYKNANKHKRADWAQKILTKYSGDK